MRSLSFNKILWLFVAATLSLGVQAKSRSSDPYNFDDEITEAFGSLELPWDADDRPDYLGRKEQRIRHKQRVCRSCQVAKPKEIVHATRLQAKAIASSIPSTDFMKRLAAAAPRYGHAERLYCYRGVKKIINAVSPSIAKMFNGSRLAIHAMSLLPRAGFRNDLPGSCNRPGVIRVYKGPASGMSAGQAKNFMRKHYGVKATAGDYAGHIEVLGNDGRWHHFTSSAAPINSPSHFGPWRRKLTGCFIR